jgi:hypothetical protein
MARGGSDVIEVIVVAGVLFMIASIVRLRWGRAHSI